MNTLILIIEDFEAKVIQGQVASFDDSRGYVVWSVGRRLFGASIQRTQQLWCSGLGIDEILEKRKYRKFETNRDIIRDNKDLFLMNPRSQKEKRIFMKDFQ